MTLRALVVLCILAGCAGEQRPVAETAHAALTALTDAGQPAYRITVAYCEGAQWKIVNGDDQPVDAKREAVAAVRARCHAIYDVFERAAKLQTAARQAVDAAQSIDAAVAAMAQVDEIRGLLVQAHKLFQDLQRENP